MAVRVSVSFDTDSLPGQLDRRTVRARLSRAVRASLRACSVKEAEISVALLDDAAIRAMNVQYLQHDYVTDVISFPLNEPGAAPLGDVYIGAQQAERQAAEHGHAVLDELTRLAVHGTLHVLGYDHPDGADRVDSDMWRLQEQILDTLRAGESA